MKKLWIFVAASLLLAGCKKEEKIVSISLDKTTLELRIADTYTFKVAHEPATLPSPANLYAWSTSNSSVATVSNMGQLTAVGEGSATITVTLTGTQLSNTCLVSVGKQLATQIILDPQTIHIEVGEQDVISYTLAPEGSVLLEGTWISDHEDIVSVQNGAIEAKGPGEAVVTLYDKSRPEIKASCAVTATRPAALSIELDATELTIEKNEEGHLTYSSLPQYSLIESVIWSSSDESIVTVDSEGKLSAMEEGVAIITVTDASNPDIQAICTVTVIEISVTAIIFAEEEVELFVGDDMVLAYSLLPVEARLSLPEWSSDDPLIATVDQNGKVTGVGEGTAVVTLTNGANRDIFASCIIKVSPVEATSLFLDDETRTINVQQEVTLTYQLLPPNTTDKEVVWSSDNESIATVDAFGKVKGISAGTCTITVKQKNGILESSCTVVVVIPVSSISLDRNSMSMTRSNSYSLSVSFLPANAAPPTAYSWSSSDEWVATVSQDGTVEALRVGTATIRVEIQGGIYATCSITVNPVYSSWQDPLLLFGSTPLSVMMSETRTMDNLTNFTEGQAIVYNGEAGSRLQYCAYVFASGALISTLLAFTDTDQTAINFARGYCAERYMLLGEIDGISVYRDRDGTHIEVGFRNLTDFIDITALQLSILGLKNRWFVISYTLI